MLPVDHVCAQSIDANAPTKIDETSIESLWMGVDIGPKTIQQYVDVLLEAKTIVWNGPMGVFELAPFRSGTEAIAHAIAEATKKWSNIHRWWRRYCCSYFHLQLGRQNVPYFHRRGCKPTNA